MSKAVALPNDERAANYRYQEAYRTHRIFTAFYRDAEDELDGRIGRPLTPAQQRRIRKHENKAKGSGLNAVTPEEVMAVLSSNPWDTRPAETSGDFGPVPTPTRPCGGTDYCITKSGKKASKPHVKCGAA